jgi:phosphoribosyl-AMP cyclohydrolase / phosphoribosyl-ATP pyrophosphohydrolase
MEINFEGENGLLPAIVQDFETKRVLMLAYMNKDAYSKTIETKKITLFDRSKNCLFVEGNESGNFLKLIDIKADINNGALLLFVSQEGNNAATITNTNWNEENKISFGFLTTLEEIIEDRKKNPSNKSYTSSLFAKGINKIAQKVGEEAVELVIEAKDNNNELFVNEAADLMFHYLILLNQKGFRLDDVANILKERHRVS